MTTYRHPYNRSAQTDEYRRPPLAQWLQRDAQRRWLLTGARKRSFEYWTKMYWATPPWLSDEQVRQMQATYNGADPSREHVDHIVPIKNPLVCGLNVPWNLQVIPAKENLAKSNTWWDNHPFENKELFGGPEPHQLRLGI